jgi:hypothetical protein
MTAFAAVGPGTDLGRHARDLERVRDAVLSGTRTPSLVRPVVARSWARTLGAGVLPDVANCRDLLTASQVEDRRRASRLRLVIDQLAAVVEPVAEASRFLLVVTDADGVVLWRRGAASVRRHADVLGFAEGALWTETAVGTNAIGTALAERSPVQVFSAEHFERHQVPWYCTASPIHDPVSGDLIGVVDVSGPALTLHPAVVALVQTSVRLAELELHRRHQASLASLGAAVEPLLPSTGVPHLVVDAHGWVARAVGLRSPERVAAPSEGRVQQVPVLGACLPEPVGDGWLLRARSATATISARLRSAPRPVLVVEHEGGTWSATLSRRQAEVLRLVADAGPAGTTAAALGRALFGDDGHEVSARAEVSRLRRVVGALVQTSPYRLGEGVSVILDG